ncbi:MAG: undecaprenyl/decaprenyl-phosphate alpha-N-acetylglucosaminyl 1-phosphate transferase, partial [bacterium]|nr:undecaprenyl/decaprenyl-phosphate alpha-N-acetylglucosaminyl 1-phosphate transferase [bacterium]
IFLGDSGSLLVGFLLGCYGVIWSQKSATILGMTAPLMALAVPLMDTALAVVRRFLRGKPIFGADRGHVHHRLLDKGLTPRSVALLLYGACGFAAALSLLTSVVYPHYAALVVLVFLAAAWLGIQKLGYDEFGLARRVVFGGEIQNMVNTQIALRSLEEAIRGANDFASCWNALRNGCREFGFSHTLLRLKGRNHPDNQDQNSRRPSWYLHIPLSDSDYVLLGRDSDTPASAAVVGPLAEIIRSSLRSRLAELALERVSPDAYEHTESILRLADAVQRHQSHAAASPTTRSAA